MAVKELGLVPDEEKIRVASPLQPEEPIAAFLEKIPGLGPFLKGVQQQTSPQGVMGPGVIAQIMAGLQQKATGQGTPQDFYNKSIGASEGIAGTAAAMSLPGETLLARLLGSAGLPMVEHAIQQGGQNPGTGFLKGLAGAGLQGATEGLMNVVKQFPLQAAAKRARNAFGLEEDAAAERIATDLAGERRQTAEDLKTFRNERTRVKAENAANAEANQLQTRDIRNADAARIRGEKADYRTAKQQTLAEHAAQVQAADAALIQAKGAHAEELAKVTMDEAKSIIPSWAEIPSTVPGVYTAVLGKGQELLSKEYGQAMTKAIDEARGKELLLPLDDIRGLKIPMQGLGNTPATAAGPPTHGVVDAAEAIYALTGMAKKKGTDWGLYRRTLDSLGDLGIAPEARAAYKEGQGVIEALDASGALHAEGGQSVLDTEKLFAAFHKVNGINRLRNREMGDWDTSPIVQASKNPPQPGPEIPKPQIEPFVPSAKTPTPVFEPTPLPEQPVREPFTPEAMPPSPDETGAIAGPLLGTRGRRAALGAQLGFLGGLATGSGASHYYSIPAVSGAIAGTALPDQWITKAPGTEPLIDLFKRLSTLGGADLRETVLHPPYRAPEPEAE